MMVHGRCNEFKGPISLEEMLDLIATAAKLFIHENEYKRDWEKFRIQTEIWSPERCYYSKRGRLNHVLPDDPNSKVRVKMRQIDDLGMIADLKSFARTRPFGGTVSLVKDRSLLAEANVYDYTFLKDFREGYLNPYLWSKIREYVIWNVRISVNNNYFRRWLDFQNSYLKGAQERIKEYI